MNRLILFAFLYTVAVLALPGCEPDTNEINVPEARTSSCNSCHGNPGTVACREDYISIQGSRATRCYQCHAQSVTLDSILIEEDGAKVFTYFDALDTTGGEAQPIPSSAHANGRIDVDQGACDVCHGFPPAENERADLLQNPDAFLPDGHYYHIETQDHFCFECHSTVIRHDVDTTLITKPNSEGEKDSTMHFKGKVLRRNIAAQSLPITDTSFHNNGHVEVSFFEKVNEKTDTTYIWNPQTRSCSNIGCHTKPGLDEKTYWK